MTSIALISAIIAYTLIVIYFTNKVIKRVDYTVYADSGQGLWQFSVTHVLISALKVKCVPSGTRL